MTSYRSIEWADGVIRLLDQRQLPHKVVWLEYGDYQSLATAIQEMVIRGAIGTGIAASCALAMTALQSRAMDARTLRAELEVAAQVLGTA